MQSAFFLRLSYGCFCFVEVYICSLQLQLAVPDNLHNEENLQEMFWCLWANAKGDINNLKQFVTENVHILNSIIVERQSSIKQLTFWIHECVYRSYLYFSTLSNVFDINITRCCDSYMLHAYDKSTLAHAKVQIGYKRLKTYSLTPS